jgi:SM-20-related protein
MALSLSPDIDVQDLRARYRDAGLVQIQPFLAPDAAERVRAHLLDRSDWSLIIQTGSPQLLEFDRATQQTLGAAKIEAFTRFAAPAAPSEFRYAYDRIIAVEGEAERREGDTILAEFADLMSSPPVLDLFREITGSDAIDFADVQATRYRAGHFLTKHHDRKKGSRRIAAYVMGLSDNWLAEWGGLLLFHDARGDIAQGLTPRMNALTLFSVPQDHSVSLVAPFCPAPRLSITGWLRPFASRPE